MLLIKKKRAAPSLGGEAPWAARELSGGRGFGADSEEEEAGGGERRGGRLKKKRESRIRQRAAGVVWQSEEKEAGSYAQGGRGGWS